MKPICRLGERSKLRANERKRERSKLNMLIAGLSISASDRAKVFAQLRKTLGVYSEY